MEQNNLERLLKLYALATRGEGGEALNARKILQRKLVGTDYTWDDIKRAADRKDSQEKSHYFHIDKKAPGLEKALAQLIFSFNLRERDWVHLAIVPNLDKKGKYIIIASVSQEEGALFAIFYRDCVSAYVSSYNDMQRRHKQERKRLKLKQDSEKRDFVTVFLAYNKLWRKIDSPDEDTGANDENDDDIDINFNIADFHTFDHDHESKLGNMQMALPLN